MNNFCIVTESTADLTPELIERFDIIVMPMRFSIDGKEYFNFPDNREMTPKSFYDLLRDGKASTTSAVNFAQFEETFSEILKNGADILYLAFSSGLSSTYSTALAAAEQLKGEYPSRRVVVVDTLAASMGEGLLVCAAAQQRESGKTIDETASWVEQNRLKLCHWFTVDDLMHLYRGGRVSAVSAHLGTALGIKPILHVDDEGHLIPKAKVRGRKQSIEFLAEKMAELRSEATGGMVFICHADALDAAQFLAGLVKAEFPAAEIQIADMGPVIGSHAGPGTVTLFFFGKER